VLKQARALFEPLPKDMATAESPTARERALLGRLPFFDPRLPIDGDMSCSSCHQPALCGTDGLPRSIGVQQRAHPRHAPTILNSALASPITFGQPDEKAVSDRVTRITGYTALFNAAFPNDPPISPAIRRRCLRPREQGWRSSSTRVAWHATTVSA
jgi:cytochrome c peroxidase